MAELNVVVSTVETEFNMKLKQNATARNLFETIVTTTGIRETWYFGFQFTSVTGSRSWLDMDKKITKQGVKVEAGGKMKFQFKFRYFPEHVVDEVIQDVTMRMLFKQVKQDILAETLFCPAEKAVLLASFAVQAKFGDFDVQEPRFLDNEKLLPAKVLSQHKLSMEEWVDKVSQFHQKHRGLDREEAILEYLKIAQDLETFGITYYEVTNQKGTVALLGIDALGINIYEVNNKLDPKVSFPWSEIGKMKATKKEFKIKFKDPKTTTHKVKAKNPKDNKQIYLMASGNHDMYIRRRAEEPLDVQQMKSQRDADRAAREKEKARLRREQEARERSEAAQRALEEKMRAMEEEMERRRRELEEAKAIIARLEAQLAETQAAREDLERQQSELKEMVEKLEHDREMEAEERQRLEQDIEEKRAEIEEFRSQVEAKEEESRDLHEQMEEAQRRLVESETAMQQYQGQSGVRMEEASMVQRSYSAANANGESVSSSDEEAARMRQAHIIEEEDEGEEGVYRHTINEEDEEESSDAESDRQPYQVPAITIDPVDEDREPDATTSELLKELRADLGSSQKPNALTAEDRQHQDNVAQGRDKFKTLRDVRKGNTQRRIDMFESM